MGSPGWETVSPLLGCWAGATGPFGQEPAWDPSKFHHPTLGECFDFSRSANSFRKCFAVGFSGCFFYIIILIFPLLSCRMRDVAHV